MLKIGFSIFIIGKRNVMINMFLCLIQKILIQFITEIYKSYECDKFFPKN